MTDGKIMKAKKNLRSKQLLKKILPVKKNEKKVPKWI